MSVIDEYLSGVTPGQKEALGRIRKIVKEIVPEASEVISYGLPTLKYNNQPLIHFAAFKDHMSVFPTADPKLSEIGEAFSKFQTSKGTLQFTEDNPIPESVITAIVQTRLDSIRRKA